MTTYDSSTYSGQALKTGDVVNIPYSGAAFQIGLRKGTYKLECWGAEGGGSRISGNSSSGKGGLGGYSVGTITLNADIILWAYVGENGKSKTSGLTARAFGGGGSAWASSSSEPANSGGGASDFRVGQDSLYARVIVAGGGGGGGEDGSDYGGYGGGTSGGRSNGYSTLAGQTSTGTGGAFGSGANTAYDGGGGGGGWYGGGTSGGTQSTPSSNSSSDTGGGCGGSGYVYTSSTASSYPSGCLLNSAYYLADAQTINGGTAFTSPAGASETGHQGDGYCRITVIDAGVTATWVSDGVTVRTDTVSPGDRLTPPDVSKDGYVASWTVGGVAIDFDTYVMPESDTTFTAIFTARKYTLMLYDNGTTTVRQEYYNATVTLPTGADTKRGFQGWYDGTNTVTSITMPASSVSLLARYDESGAKITVDSVAMQPNPVEVSKTVLLSVNVISTESAVPKWSGMSLSFGDGLPMSSPYQAGIWDTSELDPMATFEGAGIKSTGMDVPPIEAQTVPLPRCGVWSSAISGADGSCDLTITGNGSTQYTSSVVLYSDADVYVTRATISYNGGTAIPVTGTGDRLQFPSGTYSSFTIRITAISKPYSHVRVRNLAPGGL